MRHPVGMSTRRRLFAAVALTGVVGVAAPAVASAEAIPGCTVPHAWSDAPVGTQYELDLFLGQTQYDLARVSASTASAFTSATVRRATALTTALAGIGTSVVTAGVSQPPTCP